MIYDDLVDNCITQDNLREVTPETKKSGTNWLLLIFVAILVVGIIFLAFKITKTCMTGGVL